MKLAGHVVHSKKHQVTKTNSYTVEFSECHEEHPSFGYVLLFVILECGQFAVIQRLKMEEWPLLPNEDDRVTDVFYAYSNLQKLIGEHIVPAQETQNLVAIPVGDITAQVVCMKMLARFKLSFCFSIP